MSRSDTSVTRERLAVSLIILKLIRVLKLVGHFDWFCGPGKVRGNGGCRFVTEIHPLSQSNGNCHTNRKSGYGRSAKDCDNDQWGWI